MLTFFMTIVSENILIKKFREPENDRLSSLSNWFKLKFCLSIEDLTIQPIPNEVVR